MHHTSDSADIVPYALESVHFLYSIRDMWKHSEADNYFVPISPKTGVFSSIRIRYYLPVL